MYWAGNASPLGVKPVRKPRRTLGACEMNIALPLPPGERK